MPYYYYGFDWTYIYLVLPCLVLSLWASAHVNSTFRRYSKQHSLRGLTGAEAASRVLAANGVRGVRIEHISGNLNDHYDPGTNVIRLSDNVYGSTSTAAIGVACHEAGHRRSEQGLNFPKFHAPGTRRGHLQSEKAGFRKISFGNFCEIPWNYLQILWGYGNMKTFKENIFSFISPSPPGGSERDDNETSHTKES